MYVPDSQKETGGSGYRALVENGSQNPVQKETEAWWSKKVNYEQIECQIHINQRAALNEVFIKTS